MSYFCLYCYSQLPSNNPHGCNYTNHNFRAVVPIKSWSTKSAAIQNDTLYTVTDFNPSCRKVAFDCILNTTRNEIYVVVRCGVFYQTTGPGNRTWGGGEQAAAKLAIENCLNFWDARCTIRRTVPNSNNQNVGNVDYTPYFFLDTNAGYFSRRIDISVQPSAPPVVINNLVTIQCNAYVPLGTGYNALGVGGVGSRHSYTVGVTQYSAQCTPQYDNQANCTVRNPMAHEFGHMIGLPDEYLVIKSAWNQCASDSDKAGFLWRQALVAENIAVPNNTGPNNTDVSIMNDVEIRPVGFHDRHFVTVLQAARYLGQQNNLAGTWSIV